VEALALPLALLTRSWLNLVKHFQQSPLACLITWPETAMPMAPIGRVHAWWNPVTKTFDYTHRSSPKTSDRVRVS